MRIVPPRDSLDFAAGVALGAALGWALVRLARPERRVQVRGVRIPKRSDARVLAGLQTELARVARDAGDQLAGAALQRFKNVIAAPGSNGGR